MNYTLQFKIFVRKASWKIKIIITVKSEWFAQTFIPDFGKKPWSNLLNFSFADSVLDLWRHKYIVLYFQILTLSSFFFSLLFSLITYPTFLSFVGKNIPFHCQIWMSAFHSCKKKKSLYTITAEIINYVYFYLLLCTQNRNCTLITFLIRLLII